jgi:hypothetical protein
MEKFQKEGGRVLGYPSVTQSEVKRQIDQRIWDNCRISIDKTVSETSIRHGKKMLKNGLCPNRKHFILIDLKTCELLPTPNV